MDLAQVRVRLAATRPRVAAELDRPNATEALLAGVVTDLATVGRLDLLARAIGVPGTVERVLLWGADAVTGAEDLALAGALHAVLPGTGRAVLLEAEPDLVVVTTESCTLVDATVDRPGHAAARAQRGEPVPDRHLDAVTDALIRHGAGEAVTDVVRRAYAVARPAAVALELAAALDRAPAVCALATRAHDLLQPGRDPLAGWTAAATLLAGSIPRVSLRPLSWRHVADALTHEPAAATVVRRIAEFPPGAAALT